MCSADKEFLLILFLLLSFEIKFCEVGENNSVNDMDFKEDPKLNVQDFDAM